MPKKSQKIQYIILAIIGVLGITFFSSIYFTPKKEKIIIDEKNTWINMDPIQCLGNPWEFDWLKKNNNQYSKYPIGNPRKIENQEIKIIKEFYKNQNINIFDIKSTSLNVDTCSACSCPQGYKLYVSVSKEDAEKMVRMGWGN